MEKVCQNCGTTYNVKHCLIKTSKFCSRRCHDKGKTYKATGTKKKDAIRLRLQKRLSVRDISNTLKIGYGRAARYVRDYPLSAEERSSIRNRKLSEHHNKRWPKSNGAILRRLKVKKCEISGCTWSVTLEVHHKDGNQDNTSRKNIQILCPNHHSITPNYRNRGRKLIR
jgi:hypothetical protein